MRPRAGPAAVAMAMPCRTAGLFRTQRFQVQSQQMDIFEHLRGVRDAVTLKPSLQRRARVLVERFATRACGRPPNASRMRVSSSRWITVSTLPSSRAIIGMAHHSQSDLLCAKFRDLGIELVQDRDQSAHQILPAPSEHSRYGLRQHRDSRVDELQDGDETDQKRRGSGACGRGGPGYKDLCQDKRPFGLLGCRG